jgi:hypothetical protein
MMGPRRGDAMARGERRKCKCCLKLFRPNPRNRGHQCYCSAPACRAASKAASQARWLAAPENQGYFRGRCMSPGFGLAVAPSRVLYKISPRKPLIVLSKRPKSPLQGHLTAQPAVLIGLIAPLMDAPLQDPIARTTNRLLRLGQDILATGAVGAAGSNLSPRGDRLRDILQDP